MKIDLFSIPIFIGNINAEKIKIENETFKETAWSKFNSSYDSSKTNKLSKESNEYLLKNIANLLQDQIKRSFEISLINIWTNKYGVNDHQDLHFHPNSHFSFVIYKNVKESKTKFISAWSDEVEIWGMENLYSTNFDVKCRSNQICLFPSFMKHYVQKNDYPSETISGNIFIRINND